MAGKFLLNLDRQAFGEALGCLQFSSLSRFFVVQGTPKNESDQECANWICERIAQPITQILRVADTSARTLHEASVKMALICQAVAAGSFNDDRFQNIVAQVEAVNHLLTAAGRPSEGVDNRPSATRRAIEIVNTMPPRTPLALALQHGSLGQHCMHMAEASVLRRQQDFLGSDLMDQVKSWGGCPSQADRPSTSSKLMRLICLVTRVPG